MLRSGGSAVLMPELSSLLGSGLVPARETVDIQRPSLQAGRNCDSFEELNLSGCRQLLAIALSGGNSTFCFQRTMHQSR